VTGVTADGATLNWVPGDVTAATIIMVTLATDTTFASPVIGPTTLSAGAVQFAFSSTAILQGTAYIWRAAHVLNGFTSAYLAPPATGTSFTTLVPESQLPAPTFLSAVLSYTLNSQKQPQPVITLRWTNVASGARVNIYGSPTGAFASYSPVAGVGIGIASYQIQYGAGTTPPLWWVVTHVETGYLESAFSTAAES
jgi:hypothetical protein